MSLDARRAHPRPGATAPDGDIGIAAFPGANGKIVFVSDRDGGGIANREIYVMDADGSNPTRLTHNTVKDEGPVWSADGTKIAFVRDGKHFYYMNADGSGETHIFSAALSVGLAWSPDGTKIVFSGALSFADFASRNMDLFTVNLDGSEITGVCLVSTGKIQNPNWSPDGSKVAYAVQLGRDFNSDIWVDVLPLMTTSFIDDTDPAWSPDGSKIVFMSNRDGNYEIYVMNADGSGQTNLTNNAAFDAYPDWQPLQAGTIRIVNAASPADNTVFNFTDTIAAPNSFTLQNPGAITKTFATVPVGTYTVTGQPLSNWVLQDLTCDDANSSGNKTTGVATINLEVGETVTCTFTNIENNTIIVNKFSAGGDGTFPFTSTVPGYTNFNMTTTAGFTATLLSGVTAGTYAISETVPAGWNLLEADPLCSNGDRASAISLAAGEVAVCSFYNLAEDSITVKKQTIGGDGAFDFTGDLGGFTLTTKKQTAQQTFTGLTPGSTYAINETVPAGWAQTGATCDNGDAPGSVSLGVGEHITCVFTNTKQASLKVIKATDEEDGSFDFTSTIPGHTAFTLVTSNTVAITDFLNIPPGTYTLSETTPTGWFPAVVTCSDGNNPAALSLAAGEAANCLFTNVKIKYYYFPVIAKNGTP